MLQITKLYTMPDTIPNSILLKWEVADTTEDLAEYMYEIHRALNPYDEYEKIGEVVGDRFEFLDKDVNLFKRDVMYYYKLYPVYSPSSDKGEATQCTAFYDKRNDNIADYIRTVQTMYLNVIDNKRGYVLQKRRFGSRCSRCWDDIRNQHSSHNCPECFGTGYSKGYHTPYSIKFSYATPVKSSSRNFRIEGREASEDMISIWTESYPLIFEGDIFVDDNNNRYLVKASNPTTKNNEFILRHNLTLSKLPLSDTVYSVIIDREDVIKYE